MKHALSVIFLAGSAFLANANTVDPSATATLKGSPSKDGSDWDWTYTITVKTATWAISNLLRSSMSMALLVPARLGGMVGDPALT